MWSEERGPDTDGHTNDDTSSSEVEEYDGRRSRRGTSVGRRCTEDITNTPVVSTGLKRTDLGVDDTEESVKTRVHFWCNLLYPRPEG